MQRSGKGSRLSIVGIAIGGPHLGVVASAWPIREVGEMGSWLVPPIIIPLIVVMVVVYELYRAYS
jgi:hypothetical protein